MKSRSKKNNDLFKKLLNNKIVLYVVAFISLIDVIAYIVNREFGAVIFFYLIGLIAYKFSTNMTFVLGSALIATSLVHLLKNMFGFKEGFSKKKIKEGIDHSEDEDEDEEDEMNVLKKEEKNREKQIKEVKKEAKNIQKEELSREKKINKDLNKLSSELESMPEDEGFDLQNKDKFFQDKKQPMTNKKTGFTNKNSKLNPAIINNVPSKDKLAQNMSKADNIEAAYDNLEKTIGENGIRSMSGATKDLIAQQNQLVKGLKDVTPVLNEAMGALSKIDLSSLSGMFNKFSSQV